VFLDQDFVWSVGLMMSGLFFALAVLRYGVRRFRESFVNTAHADIRIGRWWDWAIRLVVVEASVLVVWWFVQVRNEPLFGPYGLGTVLLQWGIALTLFIGFNGWLVRRSEVGVASDAAAGDGVAALDRG
jgi:NSS family neurotransmitter:Na+ symporter